MSTVTTAVHKCAVDYSTYGERVLDVVQENGDDFTDPDVVEDYARDLAELLVLDEELLVKHARKEAGDMTVIGTIGDV